MPEVQPAGGGVAGEDAGLAGGGACGGLSGHGANCSGGGVLAGRADRRKGREGAGQATDGGLGGLCFLQNRSRLRSCRSESCRNVKKSSDKKASPWQWLSCARVERRARVSACCLWRSVGDGKEGNRARSTGRAVGARVRPSRMEDGVRRQATGDAHCGKPVGVVEEWWMGVGSEHEMTRRGTGRVVEGPRRGASFGVWL